MSEFLILDGGLATALESMGHDLADPLWSAKILRDDPAAIGKVHRAFVDAGADVVTTASYQATIPGLIASGLSEPESVELIRKSVWLARQATQETPVKVAASVGPYGAYLANGAEYTGNYDLTTAQLIEFHRPRWQILVEEQPGLMLCETIPSVAELEALLVLTELVPASAVWISFSCRNDHQLADGTSLIDCAAMIDQSSRVTGIGVNCVSPEWVSGLIGEIRKATGKPLAVYPNSGEGFDADSKAWTGRNSSGHLAELAAIWRDMGATMIGGCCRVSPAQIRQIARFFEG